MSLHNLFIEDAVVEAVESGAALAWRLLATLEGGSILLAATALLAYTARRKIVKGVPVRRPIKRVLVTNTTNALGREIKQQLEAHGCVVDSTRQDLGHADRVDALVVIGAEPKGDGLDGMSRLVSEDVNNNLNLLQSLSPMVKRNGCIAWACTEANAGNTTSAFADTAQAFDTVLQTSLQHVARICKCEPIWVGRCETAERTADRLIAALLTCTTEEINSTYFIRTAAQKIGKYLYRWLKIIT